MPNRIIRENILSSEPVCSLDWATEVFYRRLLSVVDDYGRYEASPALLRAKCYPLQVDRVREADISRWMAICQKAGLIVLYQGVIGGKSRGFVEVCKFGQQERTKSKFPSQNDVLPMEIQSLISNDIKGYQMPTNAHLDVSVVVDVSEGVVVDVDIGEQRLDDIFPEESESDQFQSEWHTLPAQFKRIAKWSRQRSAAFGARMKDSVFRDNWRSCIDKIAQTPFCRGENKRGWVVDVDFFLSESGFIRIFEGKYDGDTDMPQVVATADDQADGVFRKMFGKKI